jgi:exodeoxyribonuclease VII small subunit
MTTNSKSSNKMDFESSLSELEIIVEKIGSGQTSLEEMVNLYKNGVELKNNCLKKISNAKLKLENILMDE